MLRLRYRPRGDLMPRWLLYAVPVLASCDDTVFIPPPQIYDPDWDGVTDMIEDNCVVCHGEGAGTEPVLPDAFLADVLAGDGEFVVPGDPSASLFWRVISGELVDGDFAQMPLGRPLPDVSVAHVKVWIEAGAPVPEPTP
jgi:hypothetical protein